MFRRYGSRIALIVLVLLITSVMMAGRGPAAPIGNAPATGPAVSATAIHTPPSGGVADSPAPVRRAGSDATGGTGAAASLSRDAALRTGWPVSLGLNGAGFPYTPTLYDADGDGKDEIFLTGGNTFGLRGDGTFLPGWPTHEQQYMGYGTNGNFPGPSAADVDRDGGTEIMWSERDWYAGNSRMWSFNGKNLDYTNMPGFPQEAPDEQSNALYSPFVLGDTDGDGYLEAWSAHTRGNTAVYYRISAFNHLGTRLFTINLDPNESIISPYFGDLDGDGTKEMFAVAMLGNSFRLHAWTGAGVEKPGYPIVLYTVPGGWLADGPPVPVDLDQDGDLEIILGYWDGDYSYALCFHHNGAPVAGFPITLASNSQLFYIGLGDLTGDGRPELVATDNNLGSGPDDRVLALDIATGAPLPGWPFGLSAWPKGFPTIADINGDGAQEVVVETDGGQLYAISSNGMVLPGYPKLMRSPSVSGVAVGDIDGDGLLEMVAATWDGWVYAWDTTGPVRPGVADWPMRGLNARNTGVYGDVRSPADVDAEDANHSTLGAPRFVGLGSPFVDHTRIRYALPCGTDLDLWALDTTGRRVALLERGWRAAGEHQVIWDGRTDSGERLPSGTYLLALRSGAGSRSAKITLLR